MAKTKKELVVRKLFDRKLTFIVILALAAIFFFAVSQILYLQKVHSTFENYYAFRGCTRLLQKTNDFGICKTSSGETIKIVKYQNRWFLDGDLPCGFLCW